MNRLKPTSGTRRIRTTIAGAVLCAMVALASPTIANAQECQPGIDAAWSVQRATYDQLWLGLVPNLDQLRGLLDAVSNQTSYAALLTAARSIATSVPNGRLVLTLPDGTVVVDTSHADGETPANANSYAHFQAKSINENHNTRVAIMAAQAYPCGLAIETKPSTSTGNVESYLAARLGPHLNSSGTARLSIVQP
ncbi:MAG: hypothetical protein H0W08_16320 [Acidobacteria bacterium]|nr:hypothetical protein [Acidobacteriota bacterium]